MNTNRIIAVFIVANTALAMVAGTSTGIAVAYTNDDPVCTGDTCVVLPDTVQTPLGLATITVGAGNVVTVQLGPTSANTLVVGVPLSIPPGPPFARTSIDTGGGLVDIDTLVIPPGPPSRFTLPNLAIVSIHPPSPCRVRTNGTTVVFTPIIGD
jgi:hypothetical protein